MTNQLKNSLVLRALDEHAIVSITDRRGKITYVNRLFSDTSGYSEQELIGENHRILKSGFHSGEFYSDLWKTISSGKTWQGDVCNLRKDGTRYWVHSTIMPFSNENNVIEEYASIRTDITATIEIEHLLEALLAVTGNTTSQTESDLVHDVLRGISESLDIEWCSLLWINPDSQVYHQFDFINGEFRETQLTEQAMAESPFHQFQHTREIEVRSGLQQDEKFQTWGKANNIDSLMGVTLQNNHSEIKGYLCGFSSRPLHSHKMQGIRISAVQLVRDLTSKQHLKELHEANDLLDQTNEAGRIGTWELNVLSQQLTFSKVTADIYGLQGPIKFNRAQDVLNRFKAGKHRNQINRCMSRAYEKGESFDDQFQITNEHGQEVWIRVIGLPVWEQGECARLYGIIQDIDGMKCTEAALIEAKEEAEESSRIKSDFLSSMSHEMRTPLNAVIGFGQLLTIEKDLDQRKQGYAVQIVESGNHMLRLIDDLLDLSRVESNALDITLETVDLGSLLEVTCAMSESAATQKGVTIERDPIIDCAVYADEFRLKQVLLNVISNAIKYNRPDGIVRITIEDRGNHITVAISDNGLGISPENQQHLFTPFNRLGIQDSEVKGAGIGLALSQRLLDLMSAQIDVESEPGTGSTFRIILNKAKTDIQVSPAQPDESIGGHLPTIQRTILYIEDNPANVTLVEAILSIRDNIDFQTKATAEDGLDAIKKLNPDLVLVDINLPGISGFELCSILKNSPELCNIPLIAISANATQRDIDKGLALGFSQYITKPIDIDLFNRTIDLFLTDLPDSS